jgi:hypothetical protein
MELLPPYSSTTASIHCEKRPVADNHPRWHRIHRILADSLIVFEFTFIVAITAIIIIITLITKHEPRNAQTWWCETHFGLATWLSTSLPFAIIRLAVFSVKTTSWCYRRNSQAQALLHSIRFSRSSSTTSLIYSSPSYLYSSSTSVAINHGE